MKRTIIHRLGPNEPDPEGEPRRYEGGGVLRLRWKIAPYTYVERTARDPDGSVVRTTPRRGKRIDPEVAAALYEQGRTQPEIAAILECDAGAVSRVLRRRGVPARPSWSYREAPLDEVEAVRLYVEERLGTPAVARRLGVDRKRLTEVLRNLGVLRRPGAPTASRSGPAYETEFQKMRPRVRSRSGGLCEVRTSADCRGRATHVHHRKLRSQGGANSMENLIDVCLPCHGVIHGRVARSYERGLLVRSTDDPALVPVKQGL